MSPFFTIPGAQTRVIARFSAQLPALEHYCKEDYVTVARKHLRVAPPVFQMPQILQLQHRPFYRSLLLSSFLILSNLDIPFFRSFCFVTFFHSVFLTHSRSTRDAKTPIPTMLSNMIPITTPVTANITRVLRERDEWHTVHARQHCHAKAVTPYVKYPYTSLLTYLSPTLIPQGESFGELLEACSVSSATPSVPRYQREVGERKNSSEEVEGQITTDLLIGRERREERRDRRGNVREP